MCECTKVEVDVGLTLQRKEGVSLSVLFGAVTRRHTCMVDSSTDHVILKGNVNATGKKDRQHKGEGH